MTPPPSEALETATASCRPESPRADGAARGSESFWKRWAIGAALALAGAHLLLELGLRQARFVYPFETGYSLHPRSKSSYVILCVGDSATFGYGASHLGATCYPAQLQRLLRERAPGRRYRVINLGFPGANTSQLARRMEMYLHAYRPNLLILLTGNNELWNLRESRACLFGDGASWRERLGAWARVAADRCRVARFYRRLWLSVRDRRKNKLKPMQGLDPTEENYDKGLRLLGRTENLERLLRFNFAEMLNAARQYGTEVIILNYNASCHSREDRYVKSAVESLGRSTLETAPAFQAATEMGMNVYMLNDDWHPNDRGYAIYCRVIFNEMVRRSLLQAPPFDPLISRPLRPARQARYVPASARRGA